MSPVIFHDPTRVRIRPLRLPLLVAISVLSSACASLRPAPTPMPVERLAAGAAASRCAVVFLPGRYNRPAAFAKAGFAEALAVRGIDAEVVAPDAHLGYYARRTVLERLHEDVVAPLRAAGRERIWLVGVSMGGTGSLLYVQRYPGEIAGLVELAPYLGEAEVVREVASAGGLASWTAPEVLAEDDFQRSLWRSLQSIVREGEPSLFLGFGQSDDFAPGHRLLAEALPPARVAALPGGHDWRTWGRLWQAYLDTGELTTSCGRR